MGIQTTPAITAAGSDYPAEPEDRARPLRFHGVVRDDNPGSDEAEKWNCGRRSAHERDGDGEPGSLPAKKWGPRRPP
jgi:hypothetical protein